jgi:hypothetical protein
MSVSCECCVLSGRGLCDELVPHPEESYRVWCVWVWSWSLENWGGLDPQGAVEPLEKKIKILISYGGAKFIWLRILTREHRSMGSGPRKCGGFFLQNWNIFHSSRMWLQWAVVVTTASYRLLYIIILLHCVWNELWFWHSVNSFINKSVII